ncbi:MAG TPA: peptide-methionine (R)-S-oxide reductase MsrB [Caulobacteraceae bacterium]
MDRRLFLLAGAALAACGPSQAASPAEARFANSPWRKVTDAQWKQRLSPLAYDVLRKGGTERPGSSPLNKEHRRGTFVCAGCELPLFKSEWKYDADTGWPSFWTAIKENVAVTGGIADPFFGSEYHCARCLGHQGHRFHDGPRPTGLRYCNDGVSLKFVAA